jgi:hypothetical protein
MDRDKMSNFKREPSIDASHQVSLHLSEGFQRRRLKCEKLTDDRRRTTSDGKSSHCLWQGELKKMSIKYGRWHLTFVEEYYILIIIARLHTSTKVKNQNQGVKSTIKE